MKLQHNDSETLKDGIGNVEHDRPLSAFYIHLKEQITVSGSIVVYPCIECGGGFILNDSKKFFLEMDQWMKSSRTIDRGIGQVARNGFCSQLRFERGFDIHSGGEAAD